MLGWPVSKSAGKDPDRSAYEVEEEEERSWLQRFAPLLGLLAIVVIVGYILLFGGEDPYEVPQEPR